MSKKSDKYFIASKDFKDHYLHYKGETKEGHIYELDKSPVGAAVFSKKAGKQFIKFYNNLELKHVSEVLGSNDK